MTCVVKNCEKRRLYDYGQFCEEHSCCYPGCITDPHRGNKCIFHRCHAFDKYGALNCDNMVCEGKLFCVKHLCKWPRCNLNIYSIDSCMKHKCSYGRCNNMRLHDKIYCGFHDMMVNDTMYKLEYKLGTSGKRTKQIYSKKYYKEYYKELKGYYLNYNYGKEKCKYCDKIEYLVNACEDHKCVAYC